MTSLLLRAVKVVLTLLMASLVMTICWQVISRYLLSAPSLWTEEFARFCLIWIGVLGASYAYDQKAHLALNLFEDQLSERARKYQTMIQEIAVASFAILVMCIGGGRLVYITWTLDQTSPALGLPMAVVYSVVPLAGLVICISVLRSLQRLEASRAPLND